MTTRRLKGILISTAIFSLLVFLRPILPERINNQLFPQSPTPNLKVQSNIRMDTVKVKRVVDGDTIELENGERLRYIGIDTPETKHPTKPVQCYGEDAYQKNKKLVEGKTVKLVKDISEVDKYKRLLRYVYVSTPASPSGILVNDYLVRNGFAFATTFPPDVAKADQFREAQQEAREKNRGLWKSCSTI